MTSQISYTINTQIDANRTLIEEVGGSIEILLNDGLDSTSSEDYLQNLLTKNKEISDFDYFILQRFGYSDITIGDIPTEISEKLDSDNESLTDLTAVNMAITEDRNVAYIEEENILYAQPIYYQGAIIGAICGGTTHENLSQMIAIDSIRQESHPSIVTNEGKVLLDSGFSKLQNITDILTIKQNAELSNALNNYETGTMRVAISLGEVYYLSYEPLNGENWILLTLTPTDSINGVYNAHAIVAIICAIASAIIFTIAIITIINHQARSKRDLERLAFIDPVTGGHNLAYFKNEYEKLQKQGNPCEYTVLMVDINDFKLINSIAGHKDGDAILRYTYSSISSRMNEDDFEFACRMEMDHFLLCVHTQDLSELEYVGNVVLERINSDDIRETFGFRIEFSQGAYLIDDPELDVDTVIERAREAERTRNASTQETITLYEQEMSEQIKRHRQLDRTAALSLAKNEFKVYYQPKVSIKTGKVIGAEALVRWQHPEAGLIPPGEFLPVLEQSGRIQALDLFVFDNVCRWLSERIAAHKDVFKISVNFSRTHFWKEDVMEGYFEVANRYNIERSLIEFEITETAFMDGPTLQKAKECIKLMHDNGFTCAVDDFGIGYSSLSLINEMDVDTLKFDRTFFLNLNDVKAQKVVKSLYHMANELELDTVVEGIETQDQIEFLKNEKFDVVQGYYYSKPLPEEEFNEWLEKFNQ